MGSDGHTASLFPETSVLEERVMGSGTVGGKFHTHSITLTPSVFNAAKRVLFVVGGSGKAAGAWLEGSFHHNRYPSKNVNPVQGYVVWLLDGRQ
jgi:6-phosphogluconolactonase